jgi:Outer membrane efflux protein
LRSSSTLELGTSIEAKSAFIPRGSVCFRSENRCWLVFLLLLFSSSREPGWPQCAGVASTPGAASDCAAHEIPAGKIATLDPAHAYSLAELVDIAEHNNPRTRVVWERAKQKAEQLGIAKSAYYPVLTGIATFANERLIEPFPKPLAPRGYIMVEATVVQPELALQYLVFDFGKREANIGAAKAEALAAGANFIQANQDVAFQVTSDYYKLVTAQERLQAAQETLKTAQTTQDAAEARLQNGRATMPDVLNARAETSQAVFDLEAADGDEKIARVTLAEELGVDPWPVRTVTAMRRVLGTVLRSGAGLFLLIDNKQRDVLLRETDGLRDRLGKNISVIRTMSEVVEYEFGVDREQHLRSSELMLQISITAAALIWNQVAVLHDEQGIDFFAEPGLVKMRRQLADHLNIMAEAIARKTGFPSEDAASLAGPPLLNSEHNGEYTRNTIARFEDLQNLALALSREA